MKMIEFNAKVQEGKIVIPEVYQDSLNQAQVVRVTVTTTTATAESTGMISRLMKQPIQVKNFVPMSREEVHERG
jgi:hypothetical protein